MNVRPAWLFDLPESAVLYRDEHVIAIDKPAGVPCQSPAATQPEDLPALVTRRLARERGVAQDRVYLGTHQRLDQDTSGVLLYSLARESNAALAEQFQARTIEKRYLAAVSGKPPRPGTLLEHWLAPGPNSTMRVARSDEPAAKRARTRILDVRAVGARSLLTLAIETGRTHQIRAQLAAVGCPVAGDAQYGGSAALRLMLHSQHLGLTHPHTRQPLQIEASAPVELARWLEDRHDPYGDPQLLRRVLELAAARRVSLLRGYESGQTTTFRWVHGAADGLDDVYLDVYDRWLVLRVDGDERERDERALLGSLRDLGFAGAYVKRHPRQANEMVDPHDERYAPSQPAFGDPAPDALLVHERGVPFEVRLSTGLRTGLFLDQRDNRAFVCDLVTNLRDKRVLNLFGYTGSFSVMAVVAGGQCITVDVSRAALTWAERNVARVAQTNSANAHSTLADDAFVALRNMHARGERFACVVLDPPSYSTSKHGRFRVVKDYPELCAATLRVLAPGGVLIACVNHHGISYASLRRFVQKAAGAAGCALESLRELPTQRDFPAMRGEEPAMKSLLVRLATADRAGMRSASSSVDQPSTRDAERSRAVKAGPRARSHGSGASSRKPVRNHPKWSR